MGSGSQSSLGSVQNSLPEEADRCVQIDVHNGSSSSTSSTETFNNSDEKDRSVGDLIHEQLVSFSPTYIDIYSENSTHREVDSREKPHKIYQPKRLGHFDPSTDVHTVTRPNTADSLLNNIQKLSPQTSLKNS